MPRTKRHAQDPPWKRIVRQYLPEALQFFFPTVAAEIDWTKPPEYLDKELHKITREADQGDRYADLLIKVWQINGQAVFLLIHIEIQARKEDDFPLRMYTYNSRIFAQLGQHPISLAILCDRSPNWRPDHYEFRLPGTYNRFEFAIVKLLDYKSQWSMLETSPNPFATVVMAHLKTQTTTRKPLERKQWKFSLIRQLYDRGFRKQYIRDLYHFMDWVMILPEALEAEFWQELTALEEHQTMTYVTNGARIEFGKGKEEGRYEGSLALCLRLLKKRFPSLTKANGNQIAQLSLADLEDLSEAILDFSSIADLKTWLAEHL